MLLNNNCFMFKIFDLKFVECCARMESNKIWCPKKIKNKKNINDDDLAINSTRVVLEVNEMGRSYVSLWGIEWKECIDVVFIYNTKINPMILGIML